MPLINTSVPNLIQGVSQQSDATRFAGQCEEQENALSSVASGLMKRPNTRHIAKLVSSAIGSDSFVHFINRSESEKYIVIVYKEFTGTVHTGCKIRAFNLSDGTEASINSTTGGYALTSSQFEYLHTTTPRSDLKGVSIGDTTLLLNTKKAVSPKTTKTPKFDKEGLVFISQGDYNKKYSVDVSVLTDPDNFASGSSAPTLDIELERYVYREDTTGGGYGSFTVTTYRWRVASISIEDGGSGITSSSPSFSISSNETIYTQPNVTLTADTTAGSATEGQLTGVNIISGGDLAGSGSTSTTNGYAYGNSEPNITPLISGVAGGTVATLNAFKSSGSSSSTSIAANTDTIATALKDELEDANTNNFHNYFDITQPNTGSNIYLTLKGTQQDKDFRLSTTDSLANTGMKGIYKEVDAISSLPAENKNGFKVKVKGDPELATDDYYVEFATAQGQAFGNGSYVETVGGDIVTGYEASTMPHQLINDAVNSFTLEQANYADRVAGDDNSNPLPSFVGSEIEGMFFFKNRLGFLSKENIIMSEAGFGGVNDDNQVIFNFGRTSVTTLLDSDPIDVSVTSSRVTNLKSAKGFQENLVLFAENGQFVMKGGELLTPRTVSITPITNFNVEDQVEPLPLGSYIYFPFTRGAFAGLREYTVNSTTDNYDSVEITEHVPSYIPSNIIDFSGTTSEDMIALLSGDELGSLYIYNYFWNNNQKVLSAWSKFTFVGEIRGIKFINSTLYLLTTFGGHTHLLELPLENGLTDTDEPFISSSSTPTDAGFNTLLDMRVARVVPQNTTSISIPYNAGLGVAKVYSEDGELIPSSGSGQSVNVTSSGSVRNVWVGIPYTMKYTFSKQIFKASSGSSSSPTASSAMTIRNGALFFNDTNTFDVKVTPEGRTEATSTYSASTVPTSTTIGQVSFGQGFHKFAVHSKAKNAKISIENSSPFQSKFNSAEFESFVHPRSRRYG